MSEIFGNGVMGGGGLTNSKLALANAQAADVRSGKKFYAGDKQIKTGTLADVTQATPAITVHAAGKITASATQAAGVVAAGTKSATKQLPVQAAKTVIPSASAQTAVGEGVFTTGIVTVAAVYAVIGVTYPSGSTVTCTNGSKTLTAKDTTGKAIFVIPSAGTWTVKAVKGSQSASKAVSITAGGQVETVTLTFETILFDNGVVSGYAWDSSNAESGYGYAEVSKGLIHVGGFTYDNGLVLTPGWGEIGISSAIGLSDYSTLKVHLKKIDSADGTAKIHVGTTALGDNTATKTITLTAGTTTSLDISSIAGSKYISLYAQSDTGTYGNQIQAYFDKVWLE